MAKRRKEARKSDHISAPKQKKMEQSASLAKEILSSKSISIVELKGTPGSHVSELRKMFGKDSRIIVRKKPVILKALEAAAAKKSSLSGLIKYVEGAQPAVILSSVSPFKVKAVAGKAKKPSRAKIGQVSDKQIVVPAGDTGLPPGPAIGDLQKINLPAKIQKGKIVVEKETIVAKPGDVITKDIADALIKLGIEPFETDLHIVAGWENDLVYGADVLAIDEVFVLSNIMKAYSQALNLAVEAEYPTADTVELLVQKAVRAAAEVGLETKTVEGKDIGEVLGKA